MSFLNRNNLFGSGQPPQRDPYGQQPPPNRGGRPSYPPGGGGGYDTHMNGYDSPRPGYGSPGLPARNMPPRPMGHRQSPSRGAPTRGPSAVMTLQPAKSPDNSYTFRNLVAVSSQDVPPSYDGTDVFLLINGVYVVSARPLDAFPRGSIGLSEPQRSWMGVALTDLLQAEVYDPFSQGSHAYIGSMDIEIGFASTRKTTDTPYDQDDLAREITKLFNSQMFAPGQRFLMDLRSIPLNLTVKTVQLADLSEKSAPTTSDPHARGILTPQTQINFFKDGKTPINLKASSRRPAANSIIAPDFKFEDMGIGGLDAEFVTIFRRAFASRVFPPGLVEKLGIQHVKGILLYGPPGTGKTLIARQIGKMLNAREPKVINGPEVLNKYVGQSEENIRKLFADAEKEYKEKGDESGLHIIIFDELDAVCKQRGSGAAGGTGVGDSVVNQLLSKLDGVDQLNNILLIGMTNRKDMIDDALLRPGRLELHMEIALPDEHGRAQILKIHTQKMRDNQVLDPDVDLLELAHKTKNFSGAEIGGLVKSATSFAFSRHIKVGTMAGITDDVADMKVKRADFENALEEVKPAFGVSEEELSYCLRGGVIHFSQYIKDVLDEGKLFVEQVRNPKSTPLFSVCLHGPPGCGKTALAAKIAIDSGYPFIKLISNKDTLEMSESQKISYLSRVFMDAYKSPMSCVVLDDIEEYTEWTPIGPRFSNPILKTLVALLRKAPPPGRSLLIIVTATERSVLQQLDFWRHFNSDVPVANVRTYDELEFVMDESKAFEVGEASRAIAEIRDITRSEVVGVGIKHVLQAIETAKFDADRVTRFAGTLSRVIAERGEGSGGFR
ncbi:vesicle-fusing ATPase [Cladophialophora psammophila CBS 110553]|uniref:Vesicular-fusion protein SEC18 n=1 Tax=Cladophialophora psammophila CBS 110553 TaxID=1182543 RepID=W9VK86_9EURO|nr:vesicle-fusing ATPase [Cladophialophora psammophila CBS 110553]EXJ53430.1 vesicle-fusing ATPase [Cladophialophora psammophila CBS 110553]